MDTIKVTPGRSTICGGGIVSVNVPAQVIQSQVAIGSNSQWALSFEGRTQRHLVAATVNSIAESIQLKAIVPAHSEPETVQLKLFQKCSQHDAVTAFDVIANGFTYEPDPLVEILRDIIVNLENRMDDLNSSLASSCSSVEDNDEISAFDRRFNSALESVLQTNKDPNSSENTGRRSPVAALVRWATHRKLWKSRTNLRCRLQSWPKQEADDGHGHVVVQTDQWQNEGEEKNLDVRGVCDYREVDCSATTAVGESPHLHRQVKIEEKEEEEEQEEEVDSQPKCFIGGTVPEFTGGEEENEDLDLHPIQDSWTEDQQRFDYVVTTELLNSTSTCDEDVEKLFQLVMDTNLTSRIADTLPQLTPINCSETSWTGSEADSDEDIITCYVNDTPVDNRIETKAELSRFETDLSEEDEVVSRQSSMDNKPEMIKAEFKVPNINQIPIISITEHSPQPVMKVLDENLEHLNSIWETIQQLRKLDYHYCGKDTTPDERRIKLERFSASCPSLDECACAEDMLLANSVALFNRGNDLVEEANNMSGSMTIRESQSTMDLSCSPTASSKVQICLNDVRLSGFASQDRLDLEQSLADLETLTTATHSCNCVSGSGSSTSTSAAAQPPPPPKSHLKVLVVGRDAPRRRRSWSALEQADQDPESAASHLHKTLARTQRSMSLSSLDSDSEDAFYDAPDTPTFSQDSPTSPTSALDLAEVSSSSRNRRDKPRSLSGGCTPSCLLCLGNGCAAKFSLSTCHLQNPNEGISVVDGGSTAVRFKSADDHKLLPPRTPLQKSISTPSILLAKDTAAATVSPNGSNNNNNTSHNVQECDDDPAISKRKKRGSLFFRKKRGKEKEKDKDKEKEKEKDVKKNCGHQFMSVCYSNSTLCDVCGKPMANKPALRCENCMVNIHENTCRNQVGDCVRFREFSKMNARPMSLQPPTQWVIPRDRPPVYTNLKPPSPAAPAASSQSVSPTNKESRKQNGQTYFVPGISSPSTNRRAFPSGYSQWRRVATKLGVNCPQQETCKSSKVINEEKEADAVDDVMSNIFDSNSASMESLDEGAAEVNHIEDDPELRLVDEEPEGWSSTIDKKLLKKMKDRDIKRQENIYEFIITEKHHCLTLKVMQKVFAHGMLRELHMTPDMVERIFPRLEDLLEVHVSFLKRLRERQKTEAVVAGIGDILVQQFNGESARQLKAAYGEFCSRHKEAVSLYKDIYKSDRKFQNFIKKCSLRPWCKARGIPECILLVTQRITKYPLLIEALLKSSKDYKTESQDLGSANILVKDILNNVDAQVAEKEKEQRLLEIYNRIDAKSATVYGGKKFKKSDLLSSNRKLRHESQVFLKQARGKPIEVIMVMLSDVIFFLQDNTQKYTFVTQDNKAGVVSLQKLLVREKAGQDNRGIYLISSNPLDPEMYELVCQSNKDKKACVDAIRAAVEMCPDEDEGIPSESEEERKLQEAKSAKLRELTSALHDKDRELAVICEQKMKILGDMMELVAKEEVLEPVNYLHLVEDLREGPLTRDMLLAAVHEASRLTSTLYVSGTNLSRSVSSAGEHQSDAYVSPILPKRAETFGGFDNPNKDALPKPVVIKKKHQNVKEHEGWAANLVGLLTRSDHHGSTSSDLDQKESESLLSVKAKEIRRASGPLPSRDPQSPGSPDKPCLRRSTLSAGFIPLPKGEQDEGEGATPKEANDSDSVGELIALPAATSLVALGREQWTAAIQLSHYLNTLMCIFSQHFTSVESVKAELAKAQDQVNKLTQELGRNSREKRGPYRHNHQLEELRNLQEQLTQERIQWQKVKEAEEMNLREKREDLHKLQEHLKAEKDDVNQQREHLYRQLETLQKRGIGLGPNMTIVSTGCPNAAACVDSQHSDSEASAESPSLSPTTYQGDCLSPTSNQANHKRSASCDLQTRNNPSQKGSPLSPPTPTTLSTTLTTGPSYHHHQQQQQQQPVDSRSVKLGDVAKMVVVSSHSTTCPSVALQTASQAAAPKRDHTLPPNLYSATNQQKTCQNLQVKQQLPLKLSSNGSGSGQQQQQQQQQAQASNVPVAVASSKSNSFSGISSPLQHVLNNLQQARSGNSSPDSSQSPAQHPLQYSHSYPHASLAASSSASGGNNARLASPSEAAAAAAGRNRRTRDPHTNQEIIFF